MNILLQNNDLVNALATLIINVAFARICFECSLQKSAFYAAILVILNTALEVAVISISSFVIGDSFSGYNSNFILLIFQAITVIS